MFSRARISAGVSGVSPAAKTASGNLAAEAGARQHLGVLWRVGSRGRGVAGGWARRRQRRRKEGEGPDREAQGGQRNGQY